MAYPESIITRQVTFGGAVSVESGEPLIIGITTESSRSLIWVADGYRLESIAQAYTTPDPGAQITFEVPTTDQNGWLDAETRQAIIVGENEASHTYTTTLHVYSGGKVLRTYTVGPYAVPSGVEPLDGDLIATELDPITGTLTQFIPGPEATSTTAAIAAAETATTKAGEALASANAAEEAKLAAQAVPTTNDTVMAAVAADPASAFSMQQSATIADIAQLAATLDIAAWGDSMFGDNYGPNGLRVHDVLAAALGVNAYNGGGNGQTSTEIALRQGGLGVYLNITGGVIPASGPVAVTVIQPTGTWKTGSTRSFTGSIRAKSGNVIAGVLAKTTTDTWTFTRSTNGDAEAVSPEVLWVSTAGRDYVGRTQIIWSGRNNPTDATANARDDLAMVRSLPHERVLVLPIMSSSSTAINTQRATTFGPNYFDVFGWLLRNGLGIVGLNGTADDATAIAEGKLFPTLSYDGTHLTETGKIIVGNRLSEVMVAKGWYNDFTPYPVPSPIEVTNEVVNPRAGVDATGWVASAGTGGTTSGSRVASGGPLTDAPTFYRSTWSVAPSSASNANVYTVADIPTLDQRTFTIYGRASWAGAALNIRIAWLTAPGAYISETRGVATPATVDTWARYSVESTPPANAAKARILVAVDSSGSLPTTGATLDASAVMAHTSTATGAILPYRDGDSGDWGWDGATHSSTSTGLMLPY